MILQFCFAIKKSHLNGHVCCMVVMKKTKVQRRPRYLIVKIIKPTYNSCFRDEIGSAFLMLFG